MVVASMAPPTIAMLFAFCVLMVPSEAVLALAARSVLILSADHRSVVVEPLSLISRCLAASAMWVARSLALVAMLDVLVEILVACEEIDARSAAVIMAPEPTLVISVIEPVSIVSAVISHRDQRQNGLHQRHWPSAQSGQ